MSNYSKVLSKFEGLANAFEVSTKEMEEDISKKVQEIKDSNKIEILSTQKIDIFQLSNDFSVMRRTLLENIETSKTILSSFSNEIVADGVNINPKLLSAYSELLNSCNDSIKLLGLIYKDISDTHLKIKKLEENNEENSPEKVTNNLVLTNSDELLKQILKLK